MAMMMRRGSRRGRCVAQFDWLAVGRVEVGLAPGLLALGDLGGRRRALDADNGLERRPVQTGVQERANERLA